MGARHVVVAATLISALAGCGSSKPEAAPAPDASAWAAAEADSGIPPEPDAATAAAYVKALKKIDADIINNDPAEKTIDRGRDQCSSVKEWPEEHAKLIDLTNQRFISSNHPEGFGKAKAAKILAAVRKYICPTY